MGIAAVLMLCAGYGADPMNTLLQGMSNVLHCSIEISNTIVSLGFVLIAFMIDRKQIHIGTLIFPVMTSMTMRLLTPLLSADTIVQRGVCAFCGILLLALSIACSIQADCGKNPYDCVSFGLMKKTKQPYRVIRWVLDGAMLVIGIVLNGAFGVVTIINLIVLGTLITYMVTLLNRLGRRISALYIKEELSL